MQASNPLPYEVSGDKNSKNLVVFIHGFPDCMELWDNITPEVSKDAYVLNVSYPNIHPSQKTKWGVSFEELGARLKQTIDQVNDTKRAVTVVGHDWGAYVTYCFDKQFPGYAKQLITLDVPYKPKQSIFFVLYTYVLCVAFILGCCCGNFLTRLVLKVFKYNPPYAKKINYRWNFFYFQLWKSLVQSKFNPKKMFLYGYTPSVPLVYMYGKNKPLQFQGRTFLKEVEERENCEVHCTDTNHWISRQAPDFVI